MLTDFAISSMLSLVVFFGPIGIALISLAMFLIFSIVYSKGFDPNREENLRRCRRLLYYGSGSLLISVLGFAALAFAASVGP